MTLQNPLFSNNARIVRAAENAPPMRRGETDKEAVSIIQNALIGVGAGTMRRSIINGELDGDYGGETYLAVKRFQERVGLGGPRRKGDGILGRITMANLDQCAPHQSVPINLTPGRGVTPLAESQTTVQASSLVDVPKASDMYREYRKFLDLPRRGKPCQQNIIHQCAIRLSVALVASIPNFHFDNPALEYTHRPHSSCGIDVAHNAGAERLLHHLKTFWSFTRYLKSGRNSMSVEQICRAVADKPGIIFFKNLRGGTGDHIDYWNGRYTMNDLLNYNTPDERSPSEISNPVHFFQKAEQEIWFLPIRRA